MTSCIGLTKRTYSDWYRPLGAQDDKITYCEPCALHCQNPVELEKIGKEMSNYTCDCTNRNHTVLEGYLCPKCIEFRNMIVFCEFSCAGSCKSCKREVSYSVFEYCDCCSIEKSACYRCGSAILDGEGTIQNIKDFFTSFWFDPKYGDSSYLCCIEDKVDTIDKTVPLEEIKKESFRALMENITRTYSGKSKEEIIDIIQKMRILT